MTFPFQVGCVIVNGVQVWCHVECGVVVVFGNVGNVMCQ